MKALITGASSGIGRDMAIELAKRGFELVLVARNVEELQKVKRQFNTKVEVIAMDLSKQENCIQLHEQVKQVDILINNAGFGLFGEFSQTNLETELSMIDTNIKAVHILTKLYLKEMKNKNQGQILNVASIAGFMPGPMMSTYYASKAYVVRLSEGIKEELKKAKSSVKISVLCPGPVETNFNQVAGSRFKLGSLSSAFVAKYTIDKMLKGKFLIVPGIVMKLTRLLVKVTPNPIVSKFVYRIQSGK